jgi:hypothetical protein
VSRALAKYCVAWLDEGGNVRWAGRNVVGRMVTCDTLRWKFFLICRSLVLVYEGQIRCVFASDPRRKNNVLILLVHAMPSA